MVSPFARIATASALVAAVAVALSCGGDAAAPALGSADAHCFANATCNAGLVCLSNYCVVVPSDGGALDAEANDGAADATLDATTGDGSSSHDASGPMDGPSGDGMDEDAMGDGAVVDAPADVASDAPCPSGFVLCGGVCVIDDTTHCGPSCTVCPAHEQSCIDEVCACPAATPTVCGDHCVDTTSDPANCNGCSMACGAATPTCFASHCQLVPTSTVLEMNEASPHGIAVDDTNVYFTNYAANTGTVVQAPKGGGAETILGPYEQGPWDVVVDSSYVYWGWNNGASLFRIPIGGGQIDNIAPGIGGNGLALNASDIFTVENNGDVIENPIVPGGQPTYLEGNQLSPSYVAIDATYVYYETYHSVARVPIGGGSLITITTVSASTQGIAVDASSVYFGTADGTIQKVDLAGGATTVLLEGLQTPANLAVDATYVYVTDNAAGTVVDVPIGGGAPTLLAQGQSRPWGIALDATYVYWTNQGGTVMRVAKP